MTYGAQIVADKAEWDKGSIAHVEGLIFGGGRNIFFVVSGGQTEWMVADYR